MIRLVTQFDAPSARPAAATPTCSCGGCSSCCCCCIVTAIGASIYTAVNVNRLQRRMEVEAPERVRLASPLPGVIGFFAIPVSLLVAWFGAQLLRSGDFGGFLAFALFAWYGMVGLAYRGAGHPGAWWRAAGVVGVCSLLFVAEFVLWLAAASSE